MFWGVFLGVFGLLGLSACPTASQEAVDGGLDAAAPQYPDGPQPVCSPDDWCWDLPLPVGSHLNAIWGADSAHIWAVGDFGAIVFWNGSYWSAQPSSTSQNLRAVFGIDADHVWAVGDSGTILYREGPGEYAPWQSQPSNIAMALRGVFGAQANDMWAVGDLGTVLRWDGDEWHQAACVPGALRTIWGRNAQEIWIGGAADASACSGSGMGMPGRGAIWKWNGSTFQEEAITGSPAAINTLSGTAQGVLWAVGDAGTLLTRQGSLWSPPPATSPTSKDLQAIWLHSESEVWFGASRESIYHWNGSSFPISETATSDSATAAYRLRSMWGSTTTDIWAVGEYGTLLHFAGSTWVQYATLDEELRGVYDADPDHSFAVGIGGVIVHRVGGGWVRQKSDVTTTLNAVWGAGEEFVWAVGEQGTILFHDGEVWRPQSSGTRETLYAVWGASEFDVYAGGEKGTLLHWDGTSWTREALPTAVANNRVRGIAGRDQDTRELWAVLDQGIILHKQNGSWQTVASGTQSELRGVTVDTLNQVWVVGLDGVFLRGNGTSFAQFSTLSESLFAVTFKKGSKCIYAAGESGRLLRYCDGESLISVRPTGRSLLGIAASSTDAVWAVGQHGALLQGNATFTMDNDWRSFSLEVMEDFRFVRGLDGQNVWAGTRRGRILKYDGRRWNGLRIIADSDAQSAIDAQSAVVMGAQWVEVATKNSMGVPGFFGISGDSIVGGGFYPVGQAEEISGMWAQDLRHFWLVGSAMGHGIIGYRSLDGAIRIAPLTGQEPPLRGIWGVSERDIWAVGDQGAVLHYDGTTWTPQPTGTTKQLRDIWGRDATHVWAVGAAGTILFWNGTAWSQQVSNIEASLPDDLNGIWGAGATKVWAVGQNGRIQYWNGRAWTRQQAPTSENLVSIWGATAFQVWVAGNKGTLLRFNPLVLN